MRSTATLVVSALRDLTCDYTAYTWIFWALQNLSRVRAHTGVQLFSLRCSLSLASFSSRLCSLSPSPHHHSLSHHCEGRNPWRASQPDLFNILTGRLCELCVCACMRTHGRQWISQNGEEKRDWMEIINSTTYLTWGLGWRRGMAGWGPQQTSCTHTETHINALIPGLCPSLSFKWCYALILTLWLNQSPHLSCFFFRFLSFFSLMSLLHSVSRPLSLAPSSSL